MICCEKLLHKPSFKFITNSLNVHIYSIINHLIYEKPCLSFDKNFLMFCSKIPVLKPIFYVFIKSFISTSVKCCFNFRLSFSIYTKFQQICKWTNFHLQSSTFQLYASVYLNYASPCYIVHLNMWFLLSYFLGKMF